MVDAFLRQMYWTSWLSLSDITVYVIVDFEMAVAMLASLKMIGWLTDQPTNQIRPADKHIFFQ